MSRSHRILWLLEELGVSYDLKIWKRGRDGLADPKLKQIHPLGKSPVITIENPGTSEPIVIADSAAIVEYLCDYYGQNLVPQRYVDGQQGRIGTESEAWIRNRFYLHYAEGSLMPLMVMSLIFHSKSGPCPSVGPSYWLPACTKCFGSHLRLLEAQS